MYLMHMINRNVCVFRSTRQKNIVYSIDVSLYFVTYNLSLYVIS